MSNEPSVTFDDLESALLWVSSAGPCENSAFISRTTGEVFYTSITHECEDELPEDIDDAAAYLSVPDKRDLDLGRRLALQFAAEYLPDEERRVQDYFHRPGAYSRFKELLERLGLLERWYLYEQEATRSALLAWAAQKGLRVTG